MAQWRGYDPNQWCCDVTAPVMAQSHANGDCAIQIRGAAAGGGDHVSCFFLNI